MPGKFEIMRAVCKSLNSLEILPSAPDGDWFPAIATKLCEIGRGFRFQVGAARVAKENRDWPEWLYDVTWLKYEHEGEGLLIEAPLVAECEWGNEGAIDDDFEKLLLARAGIRLMIFNGFDQAESERIAERLAKKVGEFKDSRAEDGWLLAAWEGPREDWSFRCFTITSTTGILRAFDTSGHPRHP